MLTIHIKGWIGALKRTTADFQIEYTDDLIYGRGPKWTTTSTLRPFAGLMTTIHGGEVRYWGLHWLRYIKEESLFLTVPCNAIGRSLR